MSSIDIEGLEELLADMDAEMALIEAGAENAIAAAVETTYAESQARVPYDAVTKHPAGYIHLKDSAEKEVDGLEGSVTYGTDHAWYVEQGTSKMPPQPFLFPASEIARAQLVQDCEELLS